MYYSMTRQPHCPDGHGVMEREPGFWMLPGVQREKVGLLDVAPAGQFRQNGSGLVVKVWICPVCKLVRTYADDQEP